MRLPLPGAARNATSGVTGDQIASDALRYRGQGYVYGGTARAPGDWDCSSFISYVLGHDLGLAIPGGRFGGPGEPPGTHGPVVETWASWAGARTVTDPARGDLVCFVGEGPNGHIGIVLGPDQMVSALDSSQGTIVTPIKGYGPPGAPIVYRRVLGVPAGQGAAAPGQQQPAAGGGGQSAGAAALVALGVVGLMAAVVLTGAVLAGAGAVLVGSWAVGQARRQQ